MIAPEIRWRYLPGERSECRCGMNIRADKGGKSRSDIRIMVRGTEKNWIAVCLPCVALLADMVFEAEDIAQERDRYTGMKTFKGWVKMRDFLKDIYLMGPKLALVKYREENAQLEIPLFAEVDEDGNA